MRLEDTLLNVSVHLLFSTMIQTLSKKQHGKSLTYNYHLVFNHLLLCQA